MLWLLLFERHPRNRTFHSLLLDCNQPQNLRMCRQVPNRMPTRIFTFQQHPQLQKFLKNIREVARSCQHHTVVPATVNVFPVQSRLDQQLNNLQPSLERCPVQWIRSDFFSRTHHNRPELRLHLQILLCCPLSDHQPHYL